MRKIFVILFCSLFTFNLAFASSLQSSHKRKSSRISAKAELLNQKFLTALKSGDGEALESVLAEESHCLKLDLNQEFIVPRVRKLDNSLAMITHTPISYVLKKKYFELALILLKTRRIDLEACEEISYFSHFLVPFMEEGGESLEFLKKFLPYVPYGSEILEDDSCGFLIHKAIFNCKEMVPLLLARGISLDSTDTVMTNCYPGTGEFKDELEVDAIGHAIIEVSEGWASSDLVTLLRKEKAKRAAQENS